MNKNYLFPHQFRIVGWVLAIVAVAACFLFKNWFFKMPSLYYDGVPFLDDEEKTGFFCMARSGILTLAMPVFTIGLLFIGFSKEKIEDAPSADCSNCNAYGDSCQTDNQYHTE